AVEVDDTPDVLDMKLFLTTGKNVFWIIYSEDATYPIPGDPVDYDYNRDGNPDNDPDNYEDVWIRYEPEDIPNRCRGSDQNIPCLLDKISVGDENGNFTYEFGVVETQRGLFTLKLEEIDGLTDYLTQGYPDDPDDYDKLKKSWGLPEDKNFQIVIEEQRR
ncbi:MAG: hypothetical protein KKA79_03310, partial [Nanoarchaeota archaeon]|nr:hypothetical protein [Nanoarchaeota archaeon]